jgi:glutathione S-transferase
MALTLIIGNKNYSSWSLRPWIAMKVAGIAFDERVIPLYELGSREQILKYSPSGKLPVLIDDGQPIWESLAILEHLAEKFPQAGFWPADPRARSHARAIATEMHGGFQALRRNCPMNLWLLAKERPQPEEVMNDVHRIDAIWSDCRVRFGQGGPFLFGAFGAADAMFAPVATRIRTFALTVSPGSNAYIDAVLSLPTFVEWRAAALKEPWVMRHNEPDWPLVRGV